MMFDAYNLHAQIFGLWISRATYDLPVQQDFDIKRQRIDDIWTGLTLEQKRGLMTVAGWEIFKIERKIAQLKDDLVVCRALQTIFRTSAEMDAEMVEPEPEPLPPPLAHD